MRLSVAVAVAGLAMLAAAAPPARGDAVVADPGQRRVVLVSMPDRVRSAASAALGPWSIGVETSDDAPPATNAEASTIARKYGAGTVAWLDRGELVIYDDARGVSERHATVAPADDAAAAAIALSIKASMRRPADLDEPPPAVVVAAVPPPPRYLLHLAAQLGGGFPVGSETPATVRVAGRISLDLPQVPHLALAAGVEAGPSATIDNDVMTGSHRDLTITAGVEWRQPLRSHLWLVPALAAAVHSSHLEGTAINPGGGTPAVSDSSYPFGIQLEVAVETGRRVRVGASLYGGFLAGADAHRVRGSDVHVVPTTTIGLALRVSFQ